MELWIALSIAAAAFQTLRFMLQKLLNIGGLSAGGATLARFAYAVPFVWLVVGVVFALNGERFPTLSTRFWLFALMGGLAQILATWCVVALFARRNFTVGITFKKTEVLLTALVGFILLGDRVSVPGVLAIAVGLIGVLVLADPPEGEGTGWSRLMNREAGLGLLSGIFFALSAVAYRGATLTIDSDLPLIRSSLSLGFVTLSQTLGLGLWLRVFEPGELTRVARAGPRGIAIGLTSMLGSLCWFTAFTLQNAAYVFAVGQVEVIFSLAISALIFGEKTSPREGLGIVLISASVVAMALLR